ncbi:GNAT family N-acetyltransferase [Cohnella hashimotonis]|uniref:GNAT family N-acetyltransferase n=1 Tax=Cohnella hashimotonis TaxID=2826895 RepID=A0ABT6TFX0_9BACL|nr:GNAT family N-acetyltransferase [Cohnella hashimotonis]MDI4645644.1 GNAT family N-acetyltransferase [Cohnella hashimotonis]
MRKRLIVTDGSRTAEAEIRIYAREDFKALIEIQAESFPPPYPSELWWNEAQLEEHVTRFPDGALCVSVDGRLAGSMTALRRTLTDGDGHSWAEATDNGYIRNHEPEGDTLYVVDLCVRPAYRSLGLGKWLIQSMHETAVHLGCRRLLSGGRMPGYHKHADRLTPEQYLEEVAAGRLRDPVVSFLIRCGRYPIGVAHGYLEDEESCNNAALMEWRNPFIG